MVEKIYKKPDRIYLTKGANEKKVIDPKIKLKHTRKCFELNQQKDCKIISEKKLTKSQEKVYNLVIEEDRIKNTKKSIKKDILS